VNLRGELRAFGRWLPSRAWSRAGAVAEVVGEFGEAVGEAGTAGRERRVLAHAGRVALFALGVLTIAVAVAVMLWNQLGPGPLDVFIGAVRTRTGLPLTLAVWVTIGSMLGVAWLLGRRPGLGSIVGPLFMGPIMQFTLEQLGQFAVPSELAARVAVQLTAIAMIGLGAGALIASGLGAGSGELLASAASDRSGHPEPRMRLAFEVTWLVLGVALGGPIGVGTVLVATLIGPAVAHGHRLVDRAVTASRRQFPAFA
jgi:uncharacterized membrane protein YczE